MAGSGDKQISSDDFISMRKIALCRFPLGNVLCVQKMATDETADKDRRAYKVPIPGNKSVVVTYGYPLYLG